MTRLRVDVRIRVGQHLPDLAAFIARCEEAGFDGVGIHDHPASGRDAYLALALAARVTHRLCLFPATSSPVVRHPLLLASLAHSLAPEQVAAAVRAMVRVQRVLRADPAQVAVIGQRWFLPGAATIMTTLVERGLPFYDPVISEPAVAALNRCAHALGLLATAVSYGYVVPTRFQPLWRGEP